MPQAAAVLVVTRRTNSHNCHVRCGALWARPPSWHRLSPGCMPVELKQSCHVVVAILEVRVRGVAVSPRQCARKTCRRHRRGERSCTEPKAHERVSCAAISASHPSAVGFGVSGRACGPDGDLGMNLRAVEHKHGTAAAQHLDRRGVRRGSFGTRRAPVRAASSRSNRRALTPISRPRADRPSHVPVSKVSGPSLRAILIMPTTSLLQRIPYIRVRVGPFNPR